MDVKDIIPVVGFVFAVGLCLSPMPKLISCAKNGRFQEVPVVFLVFNHISRVAWFIFGVRNGVRPYIITTSFTVTSSLIVLFSYFYYKQSLAKFVVMYAFAALLVGSVLMFVLPNDILGSLASALTSFMYVSVASKLKQAMDQKNHRLIDINITLASLINGLLWTVFAIIRGDIFFFIPNFIGSIVASSQLLVYFILSSYYSEKKID